MSVTIINKGDTNKGVDVGTFKAMNETLIRVTSQAKRLANFSQGYQTGQTKNGIMYKSKWKVQTNKGGFNDGPGDPADNEISVKPSLQNGYVGVNNDHASYVEFGTRQQASQPFLRPAVDIETKGATYQQAIRKIMIEQMENAMKAPDKKTVIT